MPFNLFQNAPRFVGSLRVVILAEKTQASRPVFIHERPNTPHHCHFIVHRFRIITQLAQISVRADRSPHKKLKRAVLIFYLCLLCSFLCLLCSVPPFVGHSGVALPPPATGCMKFFHFGAVSRQNTHQYWKNRRSL